MNTTEFFKIEVPQLFSTLDPAAKGVWGVLNAQQVVEHLAWSFEQAAGMHPQALQTPAEMVEKMQAFALSDKPFRPNTKNSLMSETPAPVIKANMAESIDWLKQAVDQFLAYFEANPNAILLNPFFGELNQAGWTTLLKKHCIHHLNQFELINQEQNS